MSRVHTYNTLHPLLVRAQDYPGLQFDCQKLVNSRNPEYKKLEESIVKKNNLATKNQLHFVLISK